MTVLSRGARARRGGRRPGWVLMTVLLVLAIAASSALVFTDRVELLKLAVILALWAAVAAAFVSVIYRRQSDADQAKVRDLKLVYDLQLDREISARREYELSVESHLRRELANELRVQSADEVAALRAELAALRNNLEILFDTDLAHRPAIETDRSYQVMPDRVSSSRITSVRQEPAYPVAGDSDRIIDVPEEPLAHQPRRPDESYRGSHRRPSEETGVIPQVRPGPPPTAPPPVVPPQTTPPPSPSSSSSSPPPAAARPVPPQTFGAALATPAPPTRPKPPPPQKHSGSDVDQRPPLEGRGKHSVPGQPARDQPRRDEPAAAPQEPPPPPARHRGPDAEDSEPPTGGQSVADLMARLQAAGTPAEGGRRRRRED